MEHRRCAYRPVIFANHDGFTRSLLRVDQFIQHRRFDKWLIGNHKNPVFHSRIGADRGPDRGRHAFFPILIVQDLNAEPGGNFSDDLVISRPKYDHATRGTRPECRRNTMPDQTFSFVPEELFGPSQPLRSACGEDHNSDLHASIIDFSKIVSAREWMTSLVLSIWPDLPASTALISASIDKAISSGVCAPISRPAGPYKWASCSFDRTNPCCSSSPTIRSNFFFGPREPIYLTLRPANSFNMARS